MITNRLKPEDEAVNKSPAPELSTTNPAKDVLPEMEATGRMPETAAKSMVASGVIVVPISTFPPAFILILSVPFCVMNCIIPVVLLALFSPICTFAFEAIDVEFNNCKLLLEDMANAGIAAPPVSFTLYA